MQLVDIPYTENITKIYQTLATAERCVNAFQMFIFVSYFYFVTLGLDDMLKKCHSTALLINDFTVRNKYNISFH